MSIFALSLRNGIAVPEFERKTMARDSLWLLISVLWTAMVLVALLLGSMIFLISTR